MAQPWDEEWVEVRRCRLRSEAERYALVLSAMGIKCRIVSASSGASLLVVPEDAPRATREIAAYVRENTRHTAPAPVVRPAAEGVIAALAYAALLIFLNSVSLRNAFGFDWLAAGAANAGLIADGQLWRIVTALGLHGDGGHLLGNIAIGGLFGLLLAQMLGGGLAWLAILVAGAAGNLLAALLRSADHTSIGASTAVFGALGLLSTLSWRHQATARLKGLRRWLPFAAGAMLLAYLGMGGERTDILAHVTGFVAGIVLGLGLSWISPRLSLGANAQLGYGAAAVLILLVAWGLGLSSL